MRSTCDSETIMACGDLPVDLARRPSLHRAEDVPVSVVVSGVVARRDDDEVICASLVRRNLLIPGHRGGGWEAWRAL